MNETFEIRNTFAKAIAIKSADLLEHYQWGKQSVSDQEVLGTLNDLQALLLELQKTLRD
ncbi:MAG: hypothetical protein FD133_1003 [Erysipelotrichaceae bacterium]|nr:MAG: hypothetical protein FD179_109 [Erysipelotrichaceae bacterium]TXT18283.1 MAG: hypothetical protein FD133_1003 [Erysipelotrichaceae bacterium]